MEKTGYTFARTVKQKGEMHMSMVMPEEVICPKCTTKTTVYVWYSVCSWLDPDAAQLAREGKLNQFTCLCCGFTAPIDQDVLVNDGAAMTYYIAPKEENL